MFKNVKTRKGRLEKKIGEELNKDNPNLENVILAVEDYHRDNLDTIEKLKKKKRLELNKINGALRQTINSHGPITKSLIGSASKRIYGTLLENPTEVVGRKKISIKSLLFGFFIGVIISSIIDIIYYLTFLNG